MLTLNKLSYEEQDNVATLRLGAPVDVAVIRDLQAVCEYLEDESSCDILVLRGTEERFCGEIDMKAFDPGKPLDIHGFHKWEKALTWIERLPKLTIAAIRGRCVGAGLHLALVCDQRVATPDATFWLDEVSRGFLPGMSTFRVAKYVGLGRAKSLVLAGRQLDAATAEQWGLVDQVAAPTELEAAIDALVRAWTPENAIALELARRLLNESYGIQYEEFIGNFLAAQHRAITSERFLELLKKAHSE